MESRRQSSLSGIDRHASSERITYLNDAGDARIRSAVDRSWSEPARSPCAGSAAAYRAVSADGDSSTFLTTCGPGAAGPASGAPHPGGAVGAGEREGEAGLERGLRGGVADQQRHGSRSSIWLCGCPATMRVMTSAR